jgi:hypothetical protein
MPSAFGSVSSMTGIAIRAARTSVTFRHTPLSRHILLSQCETTQPNLLLAERQTRTERLEKGRVASPVSL